MVKLVRQTFFSTDFLAAKASQKVIFLIYTYIYTYIYIKINIFLFDHISLYYVIMMQDEKVRVVQKILLGFKTSLFYQEKSTEEGTGKRG